MMDKGASCLGRSHLALLLLLTLCVDPTLAIYGKSNPAEEKTSEFLDNLMHKYDGRIRPNFGHSPVVVNISMQIASIGHITETTMDYRVTVFLRQFWNDPRLAFTNFTKPVTVDVSILDQLWLPDLFVVNEKSASFHSVTKDNKMLRLSPNGDILLSMRLSLVLACNMKLHRFPMDEQICSVKLESYAFTTDDIQFQWVPGSSSALSIEESVELPQFVIEDFWTSNCTRSYTTGEYSCVEALIKLHRQTGYYLIQTYIPTFLIVCLSWISFWIDASASTARVALGITTVLTMTTQTSAAQEALPKVSYIKAIDTWMAVCLLFVFCALLEFSAVNYLSRLGEIKKQNMLQRMPQSPRVSNAQNLNNNQPTGAGMPEQFMLDTPTSEVTYLTGSPCNGGHVERLTPRVEKDISARIDTAARVLFPMAFLCFNLCYWIWFMM